MVKNVSIEIMRRRDLFKTVSRAGHALRELCPEISYPNVKASLQRLGFSREGKYLHLQYQLEGPDEEISQ